MSTTTNNTDLDLMTAIERGEVITQATLKQRVGVSIGLVNMLVRRAIAKGYVKAREVPRKRYAYYLTPQGFAEKSRLVAEYLDTSLDFFRQARDQYGEVFHRAHGAGLTRIALAGDGELAEIALLAAAAHGVTLIGIVDAGANHGEHHGLPVVRDLSALGPIDAVAVTDARTPQATYDSLCGTIARARILWPILLRITPDLDDIVHNVSADEDAS